MPRAPADWSMKQPILVYVNLSNLIAEMSELLAKSCTKLDLLFVNIQCASAFSLEWLGQPPELSFPLRRSAPPSNTWFRGSTRVFIQNGMSISSAVFVQRTLRVSHYFTISRYVFPLNLPLTLG